MSTVTSCAAEQEAGRKSVWTSVDGATSGSTAKGLRVLEGGVAGKPTVDMRWDICPGEHVCWLVRSRAEYDAGERALLAGAASVGDSVMIVGERVRTRHYRPFAADVDVQVGRNASAVLEAMREQTRSADESGRQLRILAQMEHLTVPDAPLEDLIARELDVSTLVDGGATSLVCAYRDAAWQPEFLGGVAAVHSQIVGPVPKSAEFRIARKGIEDWALSGAVGYESATSFGTMLRGLLGQHARPRLDCTELELVDAAGWRAMITALAAVPGASLVLEHVNKTVATTWHLSGYAESSIPLRVCK